MCVHGAVSMRRSFTWSFNVKQEREREKTSRREKELKKITFFRTWRSSLVLTVLSILSRLLTSVLVCARESEVPTVFLLKIFRCFVVIVVVVVFFPSDVYSNRFV